MKSNWHQTRKTLLYLICTGMISVCSANLEFRTERYTLHKLTPQTEQIDLLAAIVDTQLPDQIVTVGEAIDHVLRLSGFKRVDLAETRQFMDLPLPQVHRKIGPLDLRTTLQMLVGDSLRLVEHSADRKIWFESASSSDSNKTSESTTAKAHILERSANESQLIWTLRPASTLSSNLSAWTQRAGWKLEWNSPHDYEIKHEASFRGSLKDAVDAVLLHYQDAPVPLAAQFYSGNSVLVIESDIAGR